MHVPRPYFPGVCFWMALGNAQYAVSCAHCTTRVMEIHQRDRFVFCIFLLMVRCAHRKDFLLGSHCESSRAHTIDIICLCAPTGSCMLRWNLRGLCAKTLECGLQA